MQSSVAAVDRQHDGQSPEQPHEQRGIELIQPSRCPLGRHSGAVSKHMLKLQTARFRSSEELRTNL